MSKHVMSSFPLQTPTSQANIYFSIVRFIISKLAADDGDVLGPHANAFSFVFFMQYDTGCSFKSVIVMGVKLNIVSGS